MIVYICALTGKIVFLMKPVTKFIKSCQIYFDSLRFVWQPLFKDSLGWTCWILTMWNQHWSCYIGCQSNREFCISSCLFFAPHWRWTALQYLTNCIFTVSAARSRYWFRLTYRLTQQFMFYEEQLNKNQVLPPRIVCIWSTWCHWH